MRLPDRARPVVVLLGLGLALGACGDEGATGTDAITTTTAASATAPPSATSANTGTERVIRVAFHNGTVTGDARHQVRRGETVRLVVTSDVADEVHVHGYDERIDVPAGGTGELSFTADIHGVFEVELEHRHRRLFTLQVQG